MATSKQPFTTVSRHRRPRQSVGPLVMSNPTRGGPEDAFASAGFLPPPTVLARRMLYEASTVFTSYRWRTTDWSSPMGSKRRSQPSRASGRMR